MSENAELVAVLVAGLMLFIAAMRYVLYNQKLNDKRRLEILTMYENLLIENAKLKGQVQTAVDREEDHRKKIQAYKTEVTRYKNLYEKTIDKKIDKV